MPAPFSRDQLESFARQHLTYEVGAAANQAIAWYYSITTMSRPVQSALMSSTLVHLRLLADFVSRSPLRSDDVTARSYVGAWEPRRDPLGDARESINGHVAHLTMRREDRPMWNVISIAQGVFFDLEQFFDAVSADDQLAPWFVEASTLVDRFLIWSGAGMDEFDLEWDAEQDEEPATDPWWLSFPLLPTRVRGS